jgi:hypothetical protein
MALQAATLGPLSLKTSFFAGNTRLKTNSIPFVIVFAMLLPMLALAMIQSACPIYLGVNNDGSIFFDRFQGWIRVDATQLAAVLHQGCRTNFSSPPAPITSVRFAVAPKAPSSKVDEVFSLLEKNGWTRKDITPEPWTSPLRKLSGRFYMDKQTFSVGEPVFVHFEVINSGSDPYWFDTTGLPATASRSFIPIEHL